VYLGELEEASIVLGLGFRRNINWLKHIIFLVYKLPYLPQQAPCLRPLRQKQVCINI
jgi:hypothetical protein